VLPFNPDRRKGPESSLAESDTSECRVCHERVLDGTRAVIEKGSMSHAACWLGQRARRR
jgi:hypothetical protein